MKANNLSDVVVVLHGRVEVGSFGHYMLFIFIYFFINTIFYTIVLPSLRYSSVCVMGACYSCHS